MSVHLLFEHGDHVESITHRVKAEYFGELTETGAFFGADFPRTFRTRVHVIPFERVFNSDLVE